LALRTSTPSCKRFDGYAAACRDAGIPIDPSLIRHSDYQIAGGLAAFGALLDQPDRPTAIFTTNYETTFAAGLIINERGLSIPQDLSWIGFDSLSMAQIFKPRLTIVAQPVRHIGETAAKLILERMSGVGGREYEAREVVLPGALIEGFPQDLSASMRIKSAARRIRNRGIIPRVQKETKP